MLLRVVVALSNASTRSRLQQVFGQTDVVLSVLRGRELQWKNVLNASADLAVVGRSLIPQPAPEAIRGVRQMPDPPGIVVLADREDSDERADLLAAGCDAVLYSGLTPQKLLEVFQALLARRQETAARVLAERYRMGPPRLTDFSSQSPAMRSFMEVVIRVVAADVPLLILGETGTGKEWLARAIHGEGPRSAGPFIPVNCAAFPETLLESELFGHEEGAFTGATHSRRGWFELAHRGTVFLDEIAEMPYHLQVKLLRVLQEHRVQRLGGERSVLVDVRVIAATNRDLTAEVQANRFRRDLYYRLGVVTLTVPPLRERREDVPHLVRSYIEFFRPGLNSAVEDVSQEALEALCQYPWPGNVRELINVVERAMILCRGREITGDDLPDSISGRRRASGPRPPAGPEERAAIMPKEALRQPLREARKRVLQEFERHYLTELLSRTQGRIGESARHAGINPRSLYDKMKRHRLRKEDFRTRPGDSPPKRPR